MARIQADPGPGDDAPAFTREELAEAWEYVRDRLVRFPGSSPQEIEALPQPLRWTVQGTIFQLLDEPVPTSRTLSPATPPCPAPTSCTCRPMT